MIELDERNSEPLLSDSRRSKSRGGPREAEKRREVKKDACSGGRRGAVRKR